MSILRPLYRRSIGGLIALPLLALLGGCDMIVLNPAGDVARQQGDLVVIATLLMLVVIVPVMALTILFAFRYRAANENARYEPDWDHSTGLELIIWAAPLLIIICLGAVTWVGTHLLDPYRTLARTAPGRPVAANVTPLEVQVVALDWKWLFIYPQYNVATVNEFAAPVDRPIRFRISASSVMNSFYIPALAGMIYAMPGMETKLHGVFDATGAFTGLSANYSGAGFSHMRFAARSLSPAAFEAWIAQTRRSGDTLDRATYLKLERPSEKEPVRRYAAADPALFDAIVNLCVTPGKMCARDMMALDMRGGTGMAGVWNVRHLAYDKYAARGSNPPPADIAPARTGASFVEALCATPLPTGGNDSATVNAPASLAPLTGVGLRRPAEAPRPPLLAATVQDTTVPPRPFS